MNLIGTGVSRQVYIKNKIKPLYYSVNKKNDLITQGFIKVEDNQP